MLGHCTLIGARTGKVLSYTVIDVKVVGSVKMQTEGNNNHGNTNVHETGLVCTVVLSLYLTTILTS